MALVERDLLVGARAGLRRVEHLEREGRFVVVFGLRLEAGLAFLQQDALGLALARRGKTVILSSHLLSDVEDVCDRVVIYYGGKIQAMGALKELLATPDAIRITTPALPRETMERVLEIIRRDVAADKVRIDTPTQNLESYFLDVVQKARAAAAGVSCRRLAMLWHSASKCR